MQQNANVLKYKCNKRTKYKLPKHKCNINKYKWNKIQVV